MLRHGISLSIWMHGLLDGRLPDLEDLSGQFLASYQTSMTVFASLNRHIFGPMAKHGCSELRSPFKGGPSQNSNQNTITVRMLEKKVTLTRILNAVHAHVGSDPDFFLPLEFISRNCSYCLIGGTSVLPTSFQRQEYPILEFQSTMEKALEPLSTIQLS
jgi:hypothetical protein